MPNPINPIKRLRFENVLRIGGIIAISNVENIDDVRPDKAVYILTEIRMKVE